MAEAPAAHQLLQHPDYLLFDLRPGAQNQPDLLFAKVTADTYRHSAFLDHRIVPRPRDFFRLPSARAAGAPLPPPPELYIAHTSFCCSTLLARCLQATPLLSLREPRVLGVLANEYRRGGCRGAEYRNGESHHGLAPDPLDPLAQLVFRLLGKRRECERQVLIKGTNFTNNLLAPWLRLWPRGKVLLMWGALEDFLVSMCKHQQEAGNNLWPFLQAFLLDAGIPRQRHPQWQALPLLHQAVWVWCLQIKAFTAVLSAYPMADCRTLAAADFLAAPLATAGAIHAWLGCVVDTEERARQVARTMARDAKEKGPADQRAGARHTASGAVHAQGRAAVRARYATDIARAMDWARGQAGLLPDLAPLRVHRLLVQDV